VLGRPLVTDNGFWQLSTATGNRRLMTDWRLLRP
jgi:hypothetical protein